LTESSPLIPKEGNHLNILKIKKDILVMQKKEKREGLVFMYAIFWRQRWWCMGGWYGGSLGRKGIAYFGESDDCRSPVSGRHFVSAIHC